MNNDSLENISLLKDINKIVPKYIEYKLPVSTLIGNPSYKRLYIYSLKLNGKSEVFPILNLLAIRNKAPTLDQQPEDCYIGKHCCKLLILFSL